MNRKLAKLIIVSVLVVIAAAASLAFLSFLPRNVTESVTVITVDQTSCTVQTSDKFILKIKPCDVKPGETVTVTYDEKMKERFRATTP
ncbi:hypothetical protein [Candidatus Nitrosotenuis aquarius]|uniref:hypothetical protein n=1 Tax=Candidatus Nitrosotenuis aquarius TaxID=1846278 RepID=UPI000C1EBF67|nr:hypothetical protein [Candidatus Nitrosotenuis aquarius]